MTESSFTITGLTAGTEYQFRVVAYNLVGSSEPSKPTETVKPLGKIFFLGGVGFVGHKAGRTTKISFVPLSVWIDGWMDGSCSQPTR